MSTRPTPATGSTAGTSHLGMGVRTTNRVIRLPQNRKGRDFVVGDIHGCFDEVWAAMKAVGFNPDEDRLLTAGDHTDRGLGSHRVKRFLDQPYVFAILGNHCDEIVGLYDDGEPHEDVLRAYMNVIGYRNGLGWWMEISREERLEIVERLRRLPHVIELETARGLVGIVHAEVPPGMDWATFTAKVKAGDEKTIKSALWGRERYYAKYDSGVPGIDRVFVGHTPRKTSERRGNVYYVDTGAFKGVLDPEHEGHLTIANVMTSTQMLVMPPAPNEHRVAVLNEDSVPSTPFGNYAAT
jgi:serine/threonine protein phosphatase 1